MCLTKPQNIPHDRLNNEVNALPDIGLDMSQDTCDYIKIDEVCTLCLSQNDLLVLQLNIRGLVSKQSDISRLITDCTNSHKKVNVVMLCETWVTKETKNLINIPGYDFVGLEHENKKGGGVGILVARELKYKIRNEYSKMIKNMECFVIELITKGRNMLCGFIY